MTGAWCSWCGDEYSPVEYAPVSLGDEPRFCSETCAEAFWRAVDAEDAYGEAATGAPVFP